MWRGEEGKGVLTEEVSRRVRGFHFYRGDFGRVVNNGEEGYRDNGANDTRTGPFLLQGGQSSGEKKARGGQLD